MAAKPFNTTLDEAVHAQIRALAAAMHVNMSTIITLAVGAMHAAHAKSELQSRGTPGRRPKAKRWDRNKGPHPVEPSERINDQWFVREEALALGEAFRGEPSPWPRVYADPEHGIADNFDGVASMHRERELRVMAGKTHPLAYWFLGGDPNQPCDKNGDPIKPYDLSEDGYAAEQP